MTFRFGQIQFMLERRKSFPTSTYVYFLNVFKYTHCIYSMSLHHIQCTPYIYTYANIAHRLLPLLLEFVLHANSTFAKRTNVLITHSKATKRKLQQKISSPATTTTTTNISHQSQMQTTNAHCSETKHQTPHAASTIHFQCIKSKYKKWVDRSPPSTTSLWVARNASTKIKDKKFHMFPLQPQIDIRLTAKYSTPISNQFTIKQRDTFFHQAQFTWMCNARVVVGRLCIKNSKMSTAPLFATWVRIFPLNALASMHEGWA